MSQLTVNNSIVFPDGEMITLTLDRLQRYFLSAAGRSQITEPYASQQDINNFVRLNWLMRPPLTDDEIRLMPVDELIGTYYSLRQYHGDVCEFRKHPVLSAGLPDELAYDHETNLQRRIYALRNDLWSITYQGQTYRVLLPPNMLDQPECHGMVSGIAQALVIGIFSFGLGALGAVAAVAVNAAQAAASVVQSTSMAKQQAHAVGVAGEVQNGISLARQLVANPLPQAPLLQSLASNAATWNQNIQWAQPRATQVNVQWIHMFDAALMFAAVDPTMNFMPYRIDGAQYMARWKPFPKFFWSDTVAAMLQTHAGPTAVQQPQPTTSAAVPAIGLGLLLLLL